MCKPFALIACVSRLLKSLVMIPNAVVVLQKCLLRRQLSRKNMNELNNT